MLMRIAATLVLAVALVACQPGTETSPSLPTVPGPEVSPSGDLMSPSDELESPSDELESPSDELESPSESPEES
jgi:hypothetical protein